MIFKLGTWKHKVKISFDSIKFFIARGKKEEINQILSHYRQDIQREASSAFYYLMIFSPRIFGLFYSPLSEEFGIYCSLLEFNPERVNPAYVKQPMNSGGENSWLIQLERKKTLVVDIVSQLMEQIEIIPEREATGEKFKFPPPPIIKNS